MQYATFEGGSDFSLQGPLKHIDGIAVNGQGNRYDGKWLRLTNKSFEEYFQMENLINRMGYRSHFLHQIVATPQNL